MIKAKSALIKLRRRIKQGEFNSERCPGCGHILGMLWKFHRIKTTVDHIIPVSLDGSDKASNLRPMCEPCNQKRGNGWNDKLKIKF